MLLVHLNNFEECDNKARSLTVVELIISIEVARTSSFEESLENYSAMLKKKTYFPNNGEFSLAIGAHYM